MLLGFSMTANNMEETCLLLSIPSLHTSYPNTTQIWKKAHIWFARRLPYFFRHSHTFFSILQPLNKLLHLVKKDAFAFSNMCFFIPLENCFFTQNISWNRDKCLYSQCLFWRLEDSERTILTVGLRFFCWFCLVLFSKGSTKINWYDHNGTSFALTTLSFNYRVFDGH